MGDLVGSVLAGKYRIKRRVGAGGMGAVYEGENVDIGKRVAIKVIEHEHAKSPELAQRFRREARAASAVESEHIVQVFDVGSDPNVGLYMVMEILSGEDLATRLEREGKAIPIDEAVTIAMQTARGLAKAHAAGVVHRDLKPANLFLTRREDESVCVKILDFGISKLQRPEGGDDTSTLKTRAGSVIGTPMYMSPEQAQGMTVDARTDIWSLGALLFEALAGRSIWDQRDTYEQMIIQIVTQKPKLDLLRGRVPDPIVQVIADALAHDANARIADASTFARRLAEASKIPAAPPSNPDLAHAATALGMPPPSGPHSQKRTTPMHIQPVQAATGIGMEVSQRTEPANRQRLLFGIGIGVFVVLFTVIAAIVISRKGSEPAPPAAAGLVPSAAAPSAEASVARLPLDPSPAKAPTESAPPPATVTATVAAKPVAAPKPAARPSAATTAPAKANPQYGAAGVSTAY